jgi:PPE-repeat protein
VAPDSVLIPGGLASYPVLQQNAQIAGVEVAAVSGASIGLGSFDLSASGDVLAGGFGGGTITGGIGRLVLTGNARTVSGTVPRLRVFGTYTLIGNLTMTAPLRVEAGRLRNSAFRIRVNNQ